MRQGGHTIATPRPATSSCASGQASDGVYDDGIVLSLRMTDTRGRGLGDWRWGRLRSDLTCRDDVIELGDQAFARDEFLARSPEIAIEMAAEVFRHFGWVDPPLSMLGEEQAKLLERRLD